MILLFPDQFRYHLSFDVISLCLPYSPLRYNGRGGNVKLCSLYSWVVFSWVRQVVLFVWTGTQPRQLSSFSKYMNILYWSPNSTHKYFGTLMLQSFVLKMCRNYQQFRTLHRFSLFIYFTWGCTGHAVIFRDSAALMILVQVKMLCFSSFPKEGYDQNWKQFPIDQNFGRWDDQHP